MRTTLLEFQPALVILDYDAKFCQPDTVRNILRLSRSTRVIVLTARPTAEDAVKVISAGAKGYYSKRISAELLAKAARVVMQGELWVSRKYAVSLIEKLLELETKQIPLQESEAERRQDRVMGIDGLSLREAQVAALLSIGTPNKQIAAQLRIAVRTVKAHLTTIFRKLNVTNRTQAVANLSRTSQP